jgi:hypothetical protein
MPLLVVVALAFALLAAAPVSRRRAAVHHDPLRAG